MLNSVNSEYSAEEKWDVYCAYNDLLLDYDELKAENAKLREYAAEAWGLFVKHGTIRPCDLQEVVSVRDGLRALGIGADE